MARGRMLDRSIKMSKKIAKTSMAGQWLYFRMLPFTDDHGRTHGDPEDIKAEILPKEAMSEKKIRTLLIELHGNELILWADDQVCEFVDWHDHQTLKGRPANSKFPEYQAVTEKGVKRLVKVDKETNETGSLSSLPLSSASKVYKDIQGLELTIEEYQKLVTNHDKESVDSVLMAMENHKGLPKKYVDAYKTASAWLKRRASKSPDQPVDKLKQTTIEDLKR